MNTQLIEIGKEAKTAAAILGKLGVNQKNEVLRTTAKNLVKDSKKLIDANAKDMENGRKNQMPEGLLDRLLLTEERIKQMAVGLEQIVDLDDPIGEVLSMKNRPNGLRIGKNAYRWAWWESSMRQDRM